MKPEEAIEILRERIDFTKEVGQMFQKSLSTVKH